MKWLYLIVGMVAAALVGATIFAILERRTEDPIMRRRVNASSGDYLAGRESLVDRILLYFGRTVEAVFIFLLASSDPGTVAAPMLNEQMPCESIASLD